MKVAVVPRARLAFLVDLSIASLARCLGGRRYGGRHEGTTRHVPDRSVSTGQTSKRCPVGGSALCVCNWLCYPPSRPCSARPCHQRVVEGPSQPPDAESASPVPAHPAAHSQRLRGSAHAFLWKKGSRRCTVALSHGTAGEMTSRAAAAIVVYRVAPGRCHSAILAAHAAICKTVAGVQSQPRACPINHVGDDILQMDVPCRLLPGSCHPGSAAHYDDG